MLFCFEFGIFLKLIKKRKMLTNILNILIEKLKIIFLIVMCKIILYIIFFNTFSCMISALNIFLF